LPHYDYECRNCGNRVEVLHGIHDNGPATCDVCGAPMRKMVTAPAIVFKGSGWAKKDFRDSKSTAAKSGAKGDSATKESSPDSGSGGESGAKGESAAAAKSGEGAGSTGKKGTSTSAPASD
jgi:putative FmdB family regulatory protein